MDATTAGPARAFRRRIALRRLADDVVEGAVEDFMHHFEVRVTHHDGRVSGVAGTAVRAPWSTCPGAGSMLEELVGHRLDDASPPRPLDPREHCTHLLDLATTAIRFAKSGTSPTRRFELTVTGWDTGTVTGVGRRDDDLELSLIVQGGRVARPEVLEGASLGRGFAAAASAAFDADGTELALHLRRAIWMSPGRGMDLDDFELLRESGLAAGVCYSSQPERIELACRNRGASLPDLPS